VMGFVSPKTFFSNERTLLSWLRSAVTLGALGCALLKSKTFHTPLGEVTNGPGCTLIFLAICVAVYATVTFRRRLAMITQARDAMGTRGEMPFFDSIAPFLFGVGMLLSLGLGVGMTLSKIGDEHAPCQANLIIIRHGEKPLDESKIHLSPTGYKRAGYLANCASHKTPALFMGPPNSIMAFASRGANTSRRGIDTVKPLAKVLNITLDHSVRKDDMPGFLMAVKKNLKCGETLLIAWQHDNLPLVLQALNPPNWKTIGAWPNSCPSATFREPTDTGNVCFDLMWQMRMSKWNDTKSWIVGFVHEFHEGFGGEKSSTCSQGLHPLKDNQMLHDEV